MTDVLIIGGGPAGATAAIYAARAGFGVTLIYKDLGALEKAERVENFYGFSKIGGKSLAEKGLRQARRVGAKIIRGEAVGLKFAEAAHFVVETTESAFEARTLLLATGTARKSPKIPGLAALEGRGVSYCAMCDGFFYRGKNVAVLGNGEYALREVAELLPIAAKVTILTNGAEISADFPKIVDIRAEKILEIAGAEEKNSFLAGLSQKKLEKIVFENGSELQADALFVAVGTAGGAELAKKIGAATDASGAIITDEKKRTNVRGVWAAGDCTGGVKQIVKAANDGAAAAISVAEFLRETAK